MKIVVKEENRAKIQAWIDEAEKGTRVRWITSDHIFFAIRDIEKRLDNLMHKKDWTGVKFSVDENAQSFPNAYRGTPESTHFEITRTTSGWTLTAVYRDRTRTNIVRPVFTERHLDAMKVFICQSKNW